MRAALCGAHAGLGSRQKEGDVFVAKHTQEADRRRAVVALVAIAKGRLGVVARSRSREAHAGHEATARESQQKAKGKKEVSNVQPLF